MENREKENIHNGGEEERGENRDTRQNMDYIIIVHVDTDSKFQTITF